MVFIHYSVLPELIINKSGILMAIFNYKQTINRTKVLRGEINTFENCVQAISYWSQEQCILLANYLNNDIYTECKIQSL
jgi:hypothetical protein